MTTTKTETEQLTFTVNAKVFSAAYHAVAHTVSRDANRPVLGCVHLERDQAPNGDGLGLRLVSTDSYMLTIATLSVEQCGDTTGDHLPPVGWSVLIDHCKALADDLKAMGKDGILLALTVDADGRGVTFAVGPKDAPTRRCYAEIFDAEFPNYRGLLPADGIAADGAIGFNPNNLATVAKVAASARMWEPSLRKGQSPLPVRMVAASELRPCHWRIPSNDDTTTPAVEVLNMPVRLG